MSTTDDNDDQCGGDSGEITSIKKECTSCEQNNIDNITKGIDSISIMDDVSSCANCGKEGNSSDMNICNRCKMVKYCNAACKKKHRTKHKKKCDRRVAELYDKKLFQEVEPDECPICMLPQPIDGNHITFESGERVICQSQFMTCCGKVICHGCMVAMKLSEGKDLCAFCRTPASIVSDLEIIKRMKKLMKAGNAKAYDMLASDYANGSTGMPQDYQKANELWLKAGELGCADGYYNLGHSYRLGRVVERDDKKSQALL